MVSFPISASKPYLQTALMSSHFSKAKATVRQAFLNVREKGSVVSSVAAAVETLLSRIVFRSVVVSQYRGPPTIFRTENFLFTYLSFLWQLDLFCIRFLPLPTIGGRRKRIDCWLLHTPNLGLCCI